MALGYHYGSIEHVIDHLTFHAKAGYARGEIMNFSGFRVRIADHPQLSCLLRCITELKTEGEVGLSHPAPCGFKGPPLLLSCYAIFEKLPVSTLDYFHRHVPEGWEDMSTSQKLVVQEGLWVVQLVPRFALRRPMTDEDLYLSLSGNDHLVLR